jgi:hypothetical protein
MTSLTSDRSSAPLRGRFVDLRRIADPAEHQRCPVRCCPGCARTFRELVSLARQRRRALSNRRERIARLLLAFGNGKSSVHRDFHGVPLLFTECVSQMAGKMLEPPLWMGWELLIMNLVSSPGGKEFWNERGYLFGEEFRRHVEDDLMKRTPHPDAKPMGAFRIGPRSE